MSFKNRPEDINKAGRPRTVGLPKRTNREIRQDELMHLLRKFKPLQSKAVQAAYKIIENPESVDANKLKASALIISTYRQLLLDTFDYRYDEEKSEEVQEDNTPVFSLRMITNNEDLNKAA
jgi:hypothetical protein